MLHHESTHRNTLVVVIACAFFFSAPARATTKGLSQIVTPDLQEEGDLSLSFQWQDKRIANPYEFQAELGVAKWLEFAVFQGLKPSEQIFGAEIALVQREPWLLSAGFVNWSTRGADPQPFLETGYYTEHHKLIGGMAYAGQHAEVILGYAYDFNKTWRAQVDFQSGSGNSVTFGFTWNATEHLQFNPAFYVSNDQGHDVMGYLVCTYTFPLWETRAADKR
ncbi:MAG TPA: hypothetical protein VMH34_02715 [Gammaproteobacteria bacterium]|nr:hypothetical protein [Gammaproteobacteria bacterium]